MDAPIQDNWCLMCDFSTRVGFFRRQFKEEGQQEVPKRIPGWSYTNKWYCVAKVLSQVSSPVYWNKGECPIDPDGVSQWIMCRLTPKRRGAMGSLLWLMLTVIEKLATQLDGAHQKFQDMQNKSTMRATSQPVFQEALDVQIAKEDLEEQLVKFAVPSLEPFFPRPASPQSKAEADQKPEPSAAAPAAPARPRSPCAAPSSGSAQAPSSALPSPGCARSSPPAVPPAQSPSEASSSEPPGPARPQPAPPSPQEASPRPPAPALAPPPRAAARRHAPRPAAASPAAPPPRDPPALPPAPPQRPPPDPSAAQGQKIPFKWKALRSQERAKDAKGAPASLPPHWERKWVTSRSESRRRGAEDRPEEQSTLRDFPSYAPSELASLTEKYQQRPGESLKAWILKVLDKGADSLVLDVKALRSLGPLTQDLLYNAILRGAPLEVPYAPLLEWCLQCWRQRWPLRVNHSDPSPNPWVSLEEAVQCLREEAMIEWIYVGKAAGLASPDAGVLSGHNKDRFIHLAPERWKSFLTKLLAKHTGTVGEIIPILREHLARNNVGNDLHSTNPDPSFPGDCGAPAQREERDSSLGPSEETSKDSETEEEMATWV